MPLYMDIHTVDSDNFTVEDVVKAHMQDLAIQEKFGVIQIKYWVNVEAKTLFCLMEGPSKEACNMVHKESHGNTACNIIEVFDDEFNLYLGEGKSVNDLAHTVSGDLDTGYRSLLLLNYIDLSGKYSHYVNEVKRQIKKYNGMPVLEAGDDIMASFIYSSSAILCAQAIGNILKTIPDPFEFSLALVSGRPVDEVGKTLFEETKKKAKYLCMLGLNMPMFIDEDTASLARKELQPPSIRAEEFREVKGDEFDFLFTLCGIVESHLSDPDFNRDKLARALGLSKSQAYRKIKAIAGIAPNQLIREIRLRKAIQTIKRGGKTMAEIAFSHGFNSPTYFTRSFRNRFGIQPGQYARISVK